jgi:type IV pilus assembly protein PilQ
MLNQFWVGKTGRFGQYLISGLVTFLLINGLAWGADNANKLIAVSMEKGTQSPTVLIETSEPVGYRYTVYDSFEPTRVVIDFPGMVISDEADKIAGDQSVVREVRVASFTLASGQLSRVEIMLAENTEYQVNLDGNKFRVTFANNAKTEMPSEPVTVAEETNVKNVTETAMDTSQGASLLLKVNVSSGRAIFESNGKLGKVKHFVLGNPPRLVVDLYGIRPSFKERSFETEDGFKAVRVGTYKDKTRLVFDASTSVLPEHTVESNTKEVLVSWDTSATPMSVAETAPMAAAEPAPMAAAEPAHEVVDVKPVVTPNKTKSPSSVEAIDFSNEDGRSVVAVALSSETQVSSPVEEGNLVRFEILNSTISRALRRTIDTSAFPSAVTSVTPYTVNDGDHQNVRIAVELKGPVAYALEKDGASLRLVIDDGAYTEPIPPAVSQIEVAAPARIQGDSSPAAHQVMLAPTTMTVTADEMAAEAARYTGEKITLVFDSANVRSILQLIGDVSGLNILASSDVQGTVTLRLIDVPWDQALDLVLETANLGKIQQGNVLRIMPKNKIREIEQADMKQQMIAIEEGVLEARTFAISYASVDDMKNYLTDIKSDRGSIIADSRNKQLIVRDVAAVLEQMQSMIAQIDKPERQVMIEARIVEANTDFSRSLGVKWNFDYQEDGGSSNGVNSINTGMGGSFLIPVVNPAAAGFSSAISIGALNDQLNIDLRLSALETSGEGKIISTPRITTLNGEKATISQGTKIPYSSVSDAGTDVQFENAELKLDVTPEINPDGSIQLDINVANSAVGSVVPTSTGDALSIEEKKAQTKVLVHDGQTTVIGGIFIEDERDAQSGVPVLMSIPVLGHLFKSSTKTRQRRELLIFITPRIVES